MGTGTRPQDGSKCHRSAASSGQGTGQGDRAGDPPQPLVRPVPPPSIPSLILKSPRARGMQTRGTFIVTSGRAAQGAPQTSWLHKPHSAGVSGPFYSGLAFAAQALRSRLALTGGSFHRKDYAARAHRQLGAAEGPAPTSEGHRQPHNAPSHPTRRSRTRAAPSAPRRPWAHVGLSPHTAASDPAGCWAACLVWGFGSCSGSVLAVG